jgi:type IV pilus assembly protein PilF
MQHKAKVKWIIITVLCVFISSCTTTHGGKVRSKKEQAETSLQLGMRYLELNMLRAAKENLEIALAMDASNERTHNALGVLHERLNQYDIAGQYYKNAIKINPESASIRNNYGRFLCERGDSAAGMQLLKQALAMPLNNRKWFAYTNIGRCELRSGKQELADGNFRQALLINGSYAPALLEMQKISYRKGSYMSARAFLERYLAVAQHNAETMWIAVQTERALGHQKLSDEYKETLFNRFPASKEAQQLKAIIKR